MPRQRHFNPAKRAQLIALVANGHALKDAAHLTGCSLRTLQREQARDPDFRQDLGRAELDERNAPLQHLQKAAATHWRAAAWLLERTDPARFGRRSPNSYQLADVQIALTTLLEAALSEVYDDEARRHLYKKLAAVSQSILAKLAATPTGPSSKASMPAPISPFVNQQQLRDDIEEASHFFNFNPTTLTSAPSARPSESPVATCGLAPTPPSAAPKPPFSRDPQGERFGSPNAPSPPPNDARPLPPPEIYRQACSIFGLEPDPAPYQAAGMYPQTSPAGSALTDWAGLASPNGRFADPPGDDSVLPVLQTLIKKVREKLEEKRRSASKSSSESSPKNGVGDHSTTPAPSKGRARSGFENAAAELNGRCAFESSSRRAPSQRG